MAFPVDVEAAAAAVDLDAGAGVAGAAAVLVGAAVAFLQRGPAVVPVREALVAVEGGLHVVGVRIVVVNDDLGRRWHRHVHILRPSLHLGVGHIVRVGAATVRLPAAEPALVTVPQVLVIVESLGAVVVFVRHVVLAGLVDDLRLLVHVVRLVLLHRVGGRHLHGVIDHMRHLERPRHRLVLVVDHRGRGLARDGQRHLHVARRQRLAGHRHLHVDRLRGLARHRHRDGHGDWHVPGVGHVHVLVLVEDLRGASDADLPAAPVPVRGAPGGVVRMAIVAVAFEVHVLIIDLVVDHAVWLRHRHRHVHVLVALDVVVVFPDVLMLHWRWAGHHHFGESRGTARDQEKQRKEQQRQQTAEKPRVRAATRFHLSLRDIDASIAFSDILKPGHRLISPIAVANIVVMLLVRGLHSRFAAFAHDRIPARAAKEI
mmetsp:Transcript_13290/g.31531  ORF Transcript_13290/g.31531 Transcript_13290/m.31531 type:complete len:429 (-) Transcript_13290:51-1337(-)